MVKRKFIKTNTNSSQSIFRYIIGIGVPLVVIVGLIILILYITKKGIFKKESSSTTKPTKPTVFPPPNHHLQFHRVVILRSSLIRY